MAHDVIVQKFGGSSVADSARIKEVAGFIKSCLNDERRIVVVVSAMGHTTNELIALANQVSSNPPKREMDMLISCGERSSMALLAMALNQIGVSCLSLTGSQSGIITDDNHSGAEIIAIKPQRVVDAFLDNQVVIIAGFQGVSEQKEITTLRRGGSDTTAVAIAAAINASVCEIYTDVPGVMDSDPRIVEHAALIPSLPFKTMESMALYGARVLAHDAIRIAREFAINLRVAKTKESVIGTHIGRVSLKPQDDQKIAVTHLRGLLRMTVSLSDLSAMNNDAGYFLCGARSGDAFVIYVSNDISQELRDTHAAVHAGLALITIHLRQNHMACKAIACISTLMMEHNLACEDLFLSGTEVFVIVNDADLNRALTLFHQGLSQLEMHS